MRTILLGLVATLLFIGAAEKPNIVLIMADVGEDWVVKFDWKNNDKDVASYNVLRGDADSQGASRRSLGCCDPDNGKARCVMEKSPRSKQPRNLAAQTWLLKSKGRE